MKWKSLLWILLMFITAAEASCRRVRENRSANADAVGATRKISAVKAEKGEIARWVEVTGEIVPDKRAIVSAKVTARVTRVLKDLGDAVKKGDVIMELEKEELELQVKQAEAMLAQAEANLAKAEAGPRPQELREAEAAYEQVKNDFERAELLLKEGAISQQAYDAVKANYIRAKEHLDLLREGVRKEDLEAARAAVQSAKTAIEYARWMLEQAEVRAPFDGRISARFVEVGDLVNAQMSPNVAQIDSLHPLRVRTSITFADYRGLQKGIKGEFYLDNRKYSAVVDKLAPSADPAGLYQVELRLEQDSGLKPGATGKIRLPVEKLFGLRIPSYSALQREGKWFVFLIQDNIVLRTEIQIGLIGEEYLQVLSGVREGQVIAASDVQLLKDKEKVEILP